jgi:CMP-N-acetylneuraminic acid synthetase
MKVVAFVPLKLNNERLPDKNTKKFDSGKPLVTYILDTLNKVNEIEEKFVYCSQERIKYYLPDGITYLSRPATLDSSFTKINEVIEAFICSVDADIYVLTHATAPFILTETIKKGISKVMSGEYDSAFSVQKLQEFMWNEHSPINYDLTSIPRTQDLPPIYSETTGLYIFTKELWKNSRRRIGFKPYLIEVTKTEAIDINTYEDFFIANAISDKLQIQ